MTTTLEEKIEKLKKEHNSLEVEQNSIALDKKFDELKAKEGTVEVRIMKTSKSSRSVSLVYHISYKMMIDSWEKKGSGKEDYIGATIQTIDIFESPKRPYKKFRIETDEITPDSYNGKIRLTNDSHGCDFSTHKTISIDIFNSIWKLARVSVNNILDGILDIKDVEWIMNGTSDDRLFSEEELTDQNIDIPHILLSTEESWKLDNQFCRVFLNKNIYFITPNSLIALDDWLSEENRSDEFAYSACSSVGERWRGSRIDEYKKLVRRIKSHKHI